MRHWFHGGRSGSGFAYALLWDHFLRYSLWAEIKGYEGKQMETDKLKKKKEKNKD